MKFKLEELPLSACRPFFGSWASPYEIFKVLSVTGGVPRYLEELRPELTAEKILQNYVLMLEGFFSTSMIKFFQLILSSTSSFRRFIRSFARWIMLHC